MELSSQKPVEKNTGGARAPEEEKDRGARESQAPTEQDTEECSSSAARAAAVLEQRMERLNPVPEICLACPREQFRFVVTHLGLHGVNRFDLMAPDRVLTSSGAGTPGSVNVAWRWTRRGDDGRRQNTQFGQQGVFGLDADQVLREFDCSLPAILSDRVGSRKKPTLGRDFYWRAARGFEWPLIVLDDVEVAQLPRCRRFVLQTSAFKFQALLVCDELLDDDGRHSLQSYFASQKICDPGASGGVQPVRPPGSINRKPGRDCFVTRLVEVVLDTPPLCVQEVRALAAAAARVVRAPASMGAATAATTRMLSRGGRVAFRARTDDSPSGDDMARAMSMLKRGASEREVEDWLLASAHGRGKDDPEKFASLTLKKSIFALANGGQLPPSERRSSRST